MGADNVVIFSELPKSYCPSPAELQLSYSPSIANVDSRKYSLSIVINTPPQPPPARGGAFHISPTRAESQPFCPPSLAELQPFYSPSLAEGARGWVDSSSQDSRDSSSKSKQIKTSQDSQDLRKSKQSTQNNHPQTPQKIPAESKIINAKNPTNTAKTITLSFVGDIILGDYLGAEGATFDAKFAEVKGNFRYFGSGVSAILKADDLSVGNLEGVLSDGDFAPAKDKTFIFKGCESYAKILRFAGIDMVNLANNHTNDYGAQGLNDTMNALKRARVRYFGEKNLALIRIKGVKFGFAGEKGWSLWTKEAILRDIERLRKMGAEIIIFSFHFGVEKSNVPNAIQRELAHFAVDNGADLVVGHHSHTLQGIEEYKGRKIVYSLANFIYGGSKLGGDKDSMIYQVRFIFGESSLDSCQKRDNNFLPNLQSIDSFGKNAIMVHNIIPISVSSSDLLNDYRPMIYPKNSDGFTRIMERLATYSEIIKGLDLDKSNLDSQESSANLGESNANNPCESSESKAK